MMKYGDRIDITERYKVLKSGNYRSWTTEPYRRDGCIFLGTRTIKEGRTYHDDGCYFVASKYIRAMLVSINATQNPIYVPLDRKE